MAVLGASNYTFAEATWTQSLQDWLLSHVRMLEFFGGVPEILVPDNLKSAVSKACRESLEREQRKQKRLLQKAQLRLEASVHDIDYQPETWSVHV